MIVYHGSMVEVQKPDVLHSRKDVDFGPGFYVTTLHDQAASWCNRFRKIVLAPVISIYELNEAVFDEMKSLVFKSYSKVWLDFISRCRMEEDQTDYDIVMGGVANDRVFTTINQYFKGKISEAIALRRLKYEKINAQICLRTQVTIDRYLKFQGSETL